MTYLLAAGCSWTDSNYFSFAHPELDCSWPKWPDIVVKEMNLPLVNEGRSGSSNEYAFLRILDKVLSDNPPTAIVWQLTEWSRVQLADRRLMSYARYDSCYHDSKRRKQDQLNLMCIHNLPLSLDGPDVIINNTLYYIEKVIRLCRDKNIELFIFQSDVIVWATWFTRYLKNFKKEHPEKYDILYNFIDGRLHNLELTNTNISKMMSGDIFKTIDNMNPSEIYGWPIWTEIGGKSITTGGNRISEEDGHPNKLGQEMIAKGVIKEWLGK